MRAAETERNAGASSDKDAEYDEVPSGSVATARARVESGGLVFLGESRLERGRCLQPARGRVTIKDRRFEAAAAREREKMAWHYAKLALDHALGRSGRNIRKAAITEADGFRTYSWPDGFETVVDLELLQ